MAESEGAALQLKVVQEAQVAYGAWLARRVIRDDLLTASRGKRLSINLYETLGRQRLLRANPFLSDKEQENLDERGLVNAGTIVQSGDILASIVRAASLQEEKPPRGKEFVRDNSLRVVPELDGAVVEFADYESSDSEDDSFPKGVLGRIQIRLRLDHPVETGDVLLIDGKEILLSAIVEDDQLTSGADVGLGVESAEALGVADVPVSMLVERSVHTVKSTKRLRVEGPRSLITLTPLHLGSVPPLQVTSENVKWLAERSCQALLGEFTSLRSDHEEFEQHLLEQLSASQPTVDLDPVQMPEGIAIVYHELLSLGLRVNLESRSGRTAIQLVPALESEIVEQSCGEIGKAETVHHRNLRPEHGGLMCGTVFGPEDEGYLRRRTLGHIQLTEPVVPWLWRYGKSSILEEILPLSAEEIEQIIHFEVNVFCRGSEIELDENLSLDSWESMGSGAAAIERLVESFSDPENVSPGFVGRESALVMRAVPILPPELRPILVMYDKLATSDLNDHYRRVISRNNRLRKLKQLEAPDVIIRNEKRMLQATVDALLANTYQQRSQVLSSDNRPLKCMLDMILGRQKSAHSKGLGWCARSRLLFDEQIPQECVEVAREIFDELRLSGDVPVLLNCPQGKPGFIARYPRCGTTPTIRLPEADRQYFELAGSCIADAEIHRVLTDEGAREALNLVRGEGTDRQQVPDQCGWLDAESDEAALQHMVDAISSGDWLIADSPRALLMAGPGGTRWSAPCPSRSPSYRLVRKA